MGWLRGGGGGGSSLFDSAEIGRESISRAFKIRKSAFYCRVENSTDRLASQVNV